MKHTHRHTGFTLVELLVVVAIILALLAIMMPALSKAFAVAHNTVCQSNLRQIGHAHRAYVADFRGIHPPTSTDTTNPHWLDLMRPYHGSADGIRFCPDANGYLADTATWAGGNMWGSRGANWWLNSNTYSVPFKGGGAYGVNIHTHSTTGWGIDINRHFKSITELTSTASIPLIGDAIWHNSPPWWTDSAPTTEPIGPNMPAGISGMGRYAIPRHLGHSINLNYMDGHTETVRLNDLWSQIWGKGYIRQGWKLIPYLSN
jgi:prepilin-type N-terminal cleavage/methylation domain-containing protein